MPSLPMLVCLKLTKSCLETCLSGLLLTKKLTRTAQDFDASTLLAAAFGEEASPTPGARLPGKKSQDVARHSAQRMPVAKLTLCIGGETFEHFEA